MHAGRRSVSAHAHWRHPVTATAFWDRYVDWCIPLLTYLPKILEVTVTNSPYSPAVRLTNSDPAWGSLPCKSTNNLSLLVPLLDFWNNFFRIGLFLYCVLLVILILFCVLPVIAVSQLEMHVRLICVIKFYLLTYLLKLQGSVWGQPTRGQDQDHCQCLSGSVEWTELGWLLVVLGFGSGFRVRVSVRLLFDYFNHTTATFSSRIRLG